MPDNAHITLYFYTAIEKIFSDILKSAFLSPKLTAFLLEYRGRNLRNTQKRTEYELSGQHIPAFLIASITNSCNLFCKGCYARANGICGENETAAVMSAGQWGGIFAQAAELGVSFILLSGGEPLLRPDVIKSAASARDILFPIFTNGTLIDDFYIDLFARSRNLIPVLSMEGGSPGTDQRRGQGVYDQLTLTMKKLHKRKILFGVSLTVTVENLDEITSVSFLDGLRRWGCRVVFYVEYIPIDRSTRHLVLSEKERRQLEETQRSLREKYDAMVFLSFPGDEKYFGGCLAAGRGFFHINPYGEAEACPFSPYSDRSLRDHSLLEALQSPFFKRLREEKWMESEHGGGCALFEREEKVKALIG